MIKEKVLLPLHYLLYAATWLRLLLIGRHLWIFSVTGHHMTCFYWCTCAVLFRECFSLSLSLSLSLFFFFYYFCRHWSHMAACLVCHSLYCLLLKSREKQPCPSTRTHTIQIGRQPHISVFTEHWLFDGCVGMLQCVWYLSKAAAVPFFMSSKYFKKWDVYQYKILMNKKTIPFLILYIF